MDSSHWYNLNPSIKFETTKKQYYGRYLYRLVYNIRRVCVATDKYVPDVVNYIREQQRNETTFANKFETAYNYYSYNKYRNDWAEVDAGLVDRVRTVMSIHKDRAKFRAEMHTMQIYAESEQDLDMIAQAISYNEGITHITRPKPGTEDALRSGQVFMNDTDFKYKVVLRDGNYGRDVKQNILNQLVQRDDVRIPGSLSRELRAKHGALWNAYFYTNDDSIVTVLCLIAPGLIGKIHPIGQLE
jgi:hypothetical protein